MIQAEVAEGWPNLLYIQAQLYERLEMHSSRSKLGSINTPESSHECIEDCTPRVGDRPGQTPLQLRPAALRYPGHSLYIVPNMAGVPCLSSLHRFPATASRTTHENGSWTLIALSLRKAAA